MISTKSSIRIKLNRIKLLELNVGTNKNNTLYKITSSKI